MRSRLRVFLSHAALDVAVSERIHFALREAGYDVFFDRASLPAGEGFHRRIRAEIERADLVVFLASAHSLRAGSYCLSELEFVEQRWPHPHGRVLPVLLETLPSTALPAYLTAVTYLTPRGNVVAETVEAVDALAAPIRRRRRVLVGTGLLALIAAVGATAGIVRRHDSSPLALPGDLGKRARVACSSGVDGGFLVAAAEPNELVELFPDGRARTVLALDGEPAALARSEPSTEEELIAIATRSTTPLHVLRGAARDPRGPFAVRNDFSDQTDARPRLATQPVEMLIHDGRIWCVLSDKQAPPAFNAFEPTNEAWKLPFFGSYTFEQLAQYGRAVDGARLRHTGSDLVAVRREKDRTPLSYISDVVRPFLDEPPELFRCARDIASGPDSSFYLVACDRRLMRISLDENGDRETRSLGALEHLPADATFDVDHRLAADGTRVVVAFTAYDTSHGRRPAWAHAFAYDPGRGLRVLQEWRDREVVSLAASGDRCVVVLRSADGAWSSCCFTL